MEGQPGGNLPLSLRLSSYRFYSMPRNVLCYGGERKLATVRMRIKKEQQQREEREQQVSLVSPVSLV